MEIEIAPRKSGKVLDDGQSFYAYMVFDRATVEAVHGDLVQATLAGEHDDEADCFAGEVLAAELTGWTGFGGHRAGTWFGHAPVVKVTRRAVFIRQFRALDC